MTNLYYSSPLHFNKNGKNKNKNPRWVKINFDLNIHKYASVRNSKETRKYVHKITMESNQQVP